MKHLENQIKEPSTCTSIEEIRAQIDLIDKQLIGLFHRRYEFVKEIVKYKEKTVDAVVAQERKDRVIEQRSAWAAELGLDKGFYAQLFRNLVEHNISKELEMIGKNNKTK